MKNICVVVPNWNGEQDLPTCLDSLIEQRLQPHIIVVDNGSVDGSVNLLNKKYPEVELLINKKNLGFAGGVNTGIRHAMELGYEYVALFNNDAVADKSWLARLYECLENNPKTGIATCKLLRAGGVRIDSTGDFYTSWGLPYPRGRGSTHLDKYDGQTDVFGASGGASLYRMRMLDKIGLFDEDFFAYYEDADLSFRAQLAGWKVIYVPAAKAYHQIGGTSSKMPGFTTLQFMKNVPLVWIKNVPRKYLWHVGWRLFLAQTMFLGRAITRGQAWPALRGSFMGFGLLFKKLPERRRIQANAKVSDKYVWQIIVQGLPPNAHALKKLSSFFRKLLGNR